MEKFYNFINKEYPKNQLVIVDEIINFVKNQLGYYIKIEGYYLLEELTILDMIYLFEKIHYSSLTEYSNKMEGFLFDYIKYLNTSNVKINFNFIDEISLYIPLSDKPYKFKNFKNKYNFKEDIFITGFSIKYKLMKDYEPEVSIYFQPGSEYVYQTNTYNQIKISKKSIHNLKNGYNYKLKLNIDMETKLKDIILMFTNNSWYSNLTTFIYKSVDFNELYKYDFLAFWLIYKLKTDDFLRSQIKTICLFNYANIESFLYYIENDFMNKVILFDASNKSVIKELENLMGFDCFNHLLSDLYSSIK